LARRLTTVIDTLGLDRERRTGWLALAREHGMPCVAVAFDTPPAECRRRNRGRAKRIPADVLTAQLRTWAATRDQLAEEGYDEVLTPLPVHVVPEAFVTAGSAVRRQQEAPTGLRFGLHLGSYTHQGGRATTAAWLREVAGTVERCGFDSLYVMDHFRQIPQLGRAWEDFLESWTTLAYLAACTERVRLGTLVSGITYRNVAHLGKIAATLDVTQWRPGRVRPRARLVRGRAQGVRLGLPVGRRPLHLLEDALQLLPVLWGPGNKPFHGQVLDVPETACYPRPLQNPLPILLGGSGARTLRLAAQYADAGKRVRRSGSGASQGGPASRAVQGGRPRSCRGHSDPTVDHVGRQEPPAGGRPGRATTSTQPEPRPLRNDVNAGTIDDHIGRFRELAERRGRGHGPPPRPRRRPSRAWRR
jgi:hypothetical protein